MNNLKKKSAIVVAFLMVFNLLIFNGQAARAQSEINLQLGTQVDGYITESDSKQTYKIQLTQAGTMTLNISSYINGVYVEFYDSEGTAVWNTDCIIGGSKDTPKKRKTTIGLEAGSYTLIISKYPYGSDNLGRYTVKADFMPANNNELEPNNGTETAQEGILNGETVTGFISWNDKSDFYKVRIDNAGTLGINLASYMGFTFLTLYNSEGKEVWGSQAVRDGSVENPKKLNLAANLEAGTYFIAVNRDNYSSGENTGKYTLKVNFDPANNNEKEPNNGAETAQEYALNSEAVVGFISLTDNDDYYKINVPKAGTVSINLASHMGGLYLNVFDLEGNKVINRVDIYDGKIDNPKKTTTEVNLETGIYVIGISKCLYDNDNTGKYSLKVNFTEAKSDEKEPNNSRENAQTITLNNQAVTGFISYRDDSDWYAFNMPMIGKAEVNLVSCMGAVYINLYDAGGNKVWYTHSVYNGSLQKPVNWKAEANLKPGKYFVEIVKNPYSSGNTGKYTLSVKFPAIMPSPPVVSEVNNKSTVVKGKTMGNGLVNVRIGSKVYSGKSDYKGNFAIKIPVQKAGTKIAVTVKNSFNYTSNERIITVIDRISPAVPSVNKVNTKSKTITGSAEAGTTVIAYVSNKNIGSAKVDKNGKYTIKISAQKVGTKIKVVVIDAAGNKSADKYVTVQK